MKGHLGPECVARKLNFSSGVIPKEIKVLNLSSSIQQFKHWFKNTILPFMKVQYENNLSSMNKLGRNNQTKQKCHHMESAKKKNL